MTESHDPAEVIQYVEELALKGVKLSKTQIWILVKCYERSRTIKSLAQEKGLTYQGMYASVHKLEQMNLLDAAVAIGKEWYYRCRFDISETADFTFKVKYRTQTLDMEELIGYLENAVHVTRNPHFIELALCFLYQRSILKEQEKKLLGPTPSEVRSYLMSMAGELEEYTLMLRQVAEMKLFDPGIRVHEMMGKMDKHSETRRLIEYWHAEFIQRWDDKTIGTHGLIGAAKPKEYSEQSLIDWKP
jgi:hypothetical protein